MATLRKGLSGVCVHKAMPRYTNKQRVLLVGSRGINARQRHLLDDLGRLLPHHKKEPKVDEARVLNEIAELKSCNGVLFLEARKRDLYAWISRQHGPSIRFQVLNIHTMDELRLTGNCGAGTRPLLAFDSSFDRKPHLKIAKEALAVTFGTPRAHPKSKPFYDHCLSFSILDDEKIWVRHYQIMSDQDELVEIGPRFVLAVNKILAGPFSGSTLYHKPIELSGGNARKLQKTATYEDRKLAQTLRTEHKLANTLPPDEVQATFKDQEEIFAS